MWFYEKVAPTRKTVHALLKPLTDRYTEELRQKLINCFVSVILFFLCLHKVKQNKITEELFIFNIPHCNEFSHFLIALHN